jgi:hypothetical protein
VTSDAFQAREHRHCREQLRLPHPIEQPQGSGMIVVTMAQHHRINVSDPVDIRQPAGLGSLAAVKQKPAPSRFHHKGGRFLRPQPRHGNERCVHRINKPFRSRDVPDDEAVAHRNPNRGADRRRSTCVLDAQLRRIGSLGLNGQDGRGPLIG